ncbi:MAG: phosphoglycerate dehydrogenase [Bacteroidia bacterium]|jgi:D-3-phosphoglycerate dehydrogenase / 2-oxoglutarate reductase
MNKILITPRSVTKEGGHPSLEKLRSEGYEVIFSTAGVQPDEYELLRRLPDCIGYLAGVEKISAKVLQTASNLKVISRNGVGINNVDLNAAKQLNITVCKTPGANSRGVAELAISLIFALVRSIPFSDANLKSGQWERKKGIEIYGKTLGIVGCGRIGKEVALMGLALGMKVFAYDPFANDFITYSGDFKYITFENVLKSADILSLHCPPSEDGTALLNKNTISLLKDGVYVINTARGELFDDDEILKALENNKIAGLAVDAFVKEPPGDKRLIAHKNVICTPHIGGFTTESVDKAMDEAVDNILKTLGSYKS